MCVNRNNINGGITMKRIIALTLAVLMIAALFCACGEKKKTDASGDTAQTGAADSQQDVVTTVDSDYDEICEVRHYRRFRQQGL